MCSEGLFTFFASGSTSQKMHLIRSPRIVDGSDIKLTEEQGFVFVLFLHHSSTQTSIAYDHLQHPFTPPPLTPAATQDRYISFIEHVRRVHRSQKYCNTGSMRGVDGASPYSISQDQKSI